MINFFDVYAVNNSNPNFAFFTPNWIALQAHYVTVWLKIDHIMSVKYCLPVAVFHFWPKLTHPAARSLCDSWASCLVSNVKVKVKGQVHRSTAIEILWIRFSSWNTKEFERKRTYLHWLVEQDAQLSQRDRATGYISFGQKWKTGTGRQYFTDIIGLPSTTVI